MGLFTNRCINRECGNRIRKGSKFCPKCGENAPKGLTHCGSCGKEISTSSKFCWSCGADQANMAAPVIARDRWARMPEDFAARIEVDAIQGWLVKPLIVEHGTRAMFFQRGKFRGEAKPGTYDVGGLISRLTHFMTDQAASILLMDAGDVELDLENDNLWTSDRYQVGTSLRLVVRIDEPEAMFVNLIKARSRVTIDDLECSLAGEAQMLMEGIVGKYQAQQLFSSLDARNEIETLLREHLATTFSRFGLSLVHLRFIDFSGTEFEEMRKRHADLQRDRERVDLKADRNKLNQRLREDLTEERMHAFKHEKDFEEFVRQTEHDLSLGQIIRDDEMNRLKERFTFERDREQLLRRIEIEGIASEEQREQAWKQLLAEERERDEKHRNELERQLDTAKNQAEIDKTKLETERLEHAEDMRQAEEGIALLREMKEIERADERHEVELEGLTLEHRGRATVQALMSIVDGPAAERLAELEKLRMRESMTPDQLLLLAAEASPGVAVALAKKYEAEGQLGQDVRVQLERRIDEQREMSKEQADRMERMMQTALQQMGGVAATRAQGIQPTQTVVTPGGVGAPIVINPQAPQAAAACRHCNATLDSGAVFCPNCGKKQ